MVTRHMYEPQIHHNLHSTESGGSNSHKMNKTPKTVYYLAFVKSPEELQDISCLLSNAAMCIKNKKAPVKGNERGTVHFACSHPFSERFFLEKLLCTQP